MKRGWFCMMNGSREMNWGDGSMMDRSYWVMDRDWGSMMDRMDWSGMMKDWGSSMVNWGMVNRLCMVTNMMNRRSMMSNMVSWAMMRVWVGDWISVLV